MSEPLWPDDQMDFNEPWADPQIQADYEKALGEFLVWFNRLDNLVCDILVQVVAKLGRPDLYMPADNLERKLHTLQVASIAMPKLHKPDVKKILELNSERNTLAHGHFDQNPYSGDYVVTTARGKRASRPVATIRTFTKQVEVAFNDVRLCSAYLVFGDIQPSLESIATLTTPR